jgi:molybdate transport system ATP-binding protein
MAHFDLVFTLHQGTFAMSLDVSVDARAIALVGPSGSGKTSVLEAIAGLRTPAGGRIAVAGHLLFDSRTHVNVPVRARRMGYVPQDILLFPHMTVRQNVHYGAHTNGHVDTATVSSLLELAPLMDRRVASLSGGERQRVALARALHSGPDVLLLDEPLAAVDLARRRRIVDALLRIRDDVGVPLVYVTHSPEEAVAIADYAVALEDGRVVAAGAPREVLGRNHGGLTATTEDTEGS